MTTLTLNLSPELEQQLLRLPPSDKLCLIQLLAQSLNDSGRILGIDIMTIVRSRFCYSKINLPKSLQFPETYNATRRLLQLSPSR